MKRIQKETFWLSFVICSILFYAVLFKVAFGADYYVDCNAAAGGDGSISAPWDDASDLTGEEFAPDDNIYLARGCSWNDEITVTSAGTSGHPITIKAYGTGDNPRIYGSTTITGWTLTSAQTYTYEHSVDDAGMDACVAAGFFAVFEDELFLTDRTSIALVEANPGSCFYDTSANKIYIHTLGSDNPSSNGATYRATNVVDSLILHGQTADYVNVEDIDFYYTSGHPIRNYHITGTVYGTAGNVISRCKSVAARHDGISMIGNDIIMRDCEVSHMYGHAAFATGSLDENDVRTSNILFENCSVGTQTHYAVAKALGRTPKAFMIETIPTGVTISGCSVNGDMHTAIVFPVHTETGQNENTHVTDFAVNASLVIGIDIDTAITGFSVRGFVVSAATEFDTIRMGPSSGAVISGARLVGATSTNKSGFSMEAAQNALIKFSTISGYTVGTAAGIIIPNTSDGTVIYGGSIYGNDYGVISDASGGGAVIKNVIFQANPVPIQIDNPDDLTTSDYNLFHNYTNIASLNYATWQSLGYDAHSINEQDPLFVSPATGNFRLGVGSPANNTGTNPFVDGDGNQYDAAGAMVWNDTTDAAVNAWANGVEMGAYGFSVNKAAALLMGF